MARIFNWQITRDGQTKSGSTKFEGDIYIIMEQEFGVEDFCMEMLAWCEEAKDGDVYDDGEVKVECVCRAYRRRHDVAKAIKRTQVRKNQSRCIP